MGAAAPATKPILSRHEEVALLEEPSDWLSVKDSFGEDWKEMLARPTGGNRLTTLASAREWAQ